MVIDMNGFVGIGIGIAVIAVVVWVLFEMRGGLRLALEGLRLEADALEQQKHRRNAMNQVAKELGFSFRPVAHASLVDEWSIPDCAFSSNKLEWRGHRIANVCHGTVGDAEVYLCDSENTYGLRSDESSGDCESASTFEPDFTFAFFRSTTLDLPQFTLEQVWNWEEVPRSWQIFMRPILKMLYFLLPIFTKWRKVEGDFRFAGKYDLAATDKNAVQRLFSEEVQSFFADQATVSVRGDGQTLILLRMETVVGIRMGTKVHRNLTDELHHGGKLIPPDEIPSFFEECVRVYDLLKRR